MWLVYLQTVESLLLETRSTLQPTFSWEKSARGASVNYNLVAYSGIPVPKYPKGITLYM